MPSSWMYVRRLTLPQALAVATLATPGIACSGTGSHDAGHNGADDAGNEICPGCGVLRDADGGVVYTDAGPYCLC